MNAMNEQEAKLLEDITRELTRGECISAFGPGIVSRATPLGHRDSRRDVVWPFHILVIVVVNKLAYDCFYLSFPSPDSLTTACALVTLVAMNLVALDRVMASWFKKTARLRWQTDRYLVVTNDRVLQVLNGKIESILWRHDFKRIDRREDVLVVCGPKANYIVASLDIKYAGHELNAK